ncbi:hypothetical protein ACJX0J_027771, partial [Zea mays]
MGGIVICASSTSRIVFAKLVILPERKISALARSLGQGRSEGGETLALLGSVGAWPDFGMLSHMGPMLFFERWGLGSRNRAPGVLNLVCISFVLVTSCQIIALKL